MELQYLLTIPDIKADPLHYVFEKKLVNKEGLILEFGVFKGVSINYIASQVPTSVYGFDSFEGLPEDWNWSDKHNPFKKGAFSLHGNLPQVRKNVHLIPGWFNKTLPVFLKEHTEPITFMHIDCDLYSSTKTIFNETKYRIQDGCIIVFDELINYPGFEQHEWKAWWEFVHETGVTWEWIGVNGYGMADYIQTKNIRDMSPLKTHPVAVKIIKNTIFNV